MRTEFFIAKRYLFAKKSTNAITWISWISVIGVTIGTAALFLILSVFNGFEELNLIYAKKTVYGIISFSNSFIQIISFVIIFNNAVIYNTS